MQLHFTQQLLKVLTISGIVVLLSFGLVACSPQRQPGSESSLQPSVTGLADQLPETEQPQELDLSFLEQDSAQDDEIEAALQALDAQFESVIPSEQDLTELDL